MQQEGTVYVADTDTLTVVYHGENFETLKNDQNYKYRVGPGSGNFYWFTIDTSVTPHTATKTFTGSSVNYKETISYTNKGEAETVTGYIIKEPTEAVLETKINGVTVKINGVEQPAGDITVVDSDEVTVVYYGENFELLNGTQQDYKFRVGGAAGNLGLYGGFTVDTTVTPHTATRVFDGLNVRSGVIGYTNKGESEVTVYTVNATSEEEPSLEPEPKITGLIVKVNGEEQTGGTVNYEDGDEITVICLGENFDRMPEYENHKNKIRIGKVTDILASSRMTVDTTSEPHTATVTYDASEVKHSDSKTVGYTNDGETYVVCYTLNCLDAVVDPVPEINGVIVKVNGVEQTGDVINYTDGDTVTVIYYGENFETLGRSTQDYKYHVGPGSGNFYYWWTIDTSGTPHTAAKDFTSSNVKHSALNEIGYTNKGEEKVVCCTLNYVEPAADPEITLATADGAQMRLSGKQGLRFTSTVSKSGDFASVKEYGTVLIPTEDLETIDDLVIGATLNGRSVCKVPAVNKYAEDDEKVTFTAVITDIAEKNYARSYTARAYAVLEDDTVVYGETYTSRSIYQIAKLILEDTSASDAEVDAAQEIVDAVEQYGDNDSSWPWNET